MRSDRGLVKNVLGRALLDDLAPVHEDDAIGDRAGKSHLVRDAQHGHAGAGQLDHDVEHLLDHLGIERGRRLVEQHDARVHAQRARDGDALLLAARELAGILVAPARGSCTRSRYCMATFSASARGIFFTHTGRQAEIVQHGQVRKQVEALEHHADLGADLVDLAQVVGELDAVDDDAGPAGAPPAG